MKRYSNRFAEMEQQPCGGWIVWSRVAGLPLDENGHLCSGESAPKVHRTNAAARETMLLLTERYKGIAKGDRR